LAAILAVLKGLEADFDRQMSEKIKLETNAAKLQAKMEHLGDLDPAKRQVAHQLQDEWHEVKKRRTQRM
jgi:hypothetical protein